MSAATAKDIRIAPITARDANALVQRVHYSGRIVQNSQLHLGVFLRGRLEGAMQFGPSLDKRKLQGLVRDTLWNGFIELSRMAFTDALPRNSESRAIGYAMRLIRKQYPHIEWVVSFADATQCGDGTIYRASGFVLTGMRENRTLYELPDGFRFAGPSVTGLGRNGGEKVRREIQRRTGILIGADGAASLRQVIEAGAKAIPGFQLRYVYFVNPAARARLTVPAIPFDKINESGAGMYRGERITRVKQAMAGDQPAQRRRDTDPPAPVHAGANVPDAA